MTLEELIRHLGPAEGPLGLLLLFASALIEYLFPPFPGDTVTLLGAFLVATHGWNFWGVLAATTLGSVAGAMADYGIGVLVARGRGGWLGRRQLVQRAQARLEWIRERIRRYGPWFIVINRFLPGVRAFFFVAAGLARLNPWQVLGLAALSALLFNLLLMAAGLALGASWDQLTALFRAYTRAVWILLGVAALAGLGYWWWRRKRRK